MTLADPLVLSGDGTAAVVTGAATGIGRHLATALAARGVPVTALDADERALRGWAEGTDGVHPVSCDVSDEPAVTAALAAAQESVGPVALVVTCAAIADHVASDEITAEHFRRTLDVNVLGSFLVARAAARLMRHTGGGSIVLVGSQLGRVTQPGRAAYSTSKAAVEMLAKVMALDLAPWGVRVNCLAPGPVLTDRTRGRLLGEDRQRSGDRMLVGRYLEPEDLVGAVAYLASPASAGTTGSTLLVDGGYSVV
jgi:NAD(P)-dependent dehydrogenase (short-subunit alcohol dehydrogenase family)